MIGRLLLPVAYLLASALYTGAAEPKHDNPLAAAPLGRVTLSTGFWAERQRVNRETTLPLCLHRCQQLGWLNNFDIAAGAAAGEHHGSRADDSNVYKILEGAEYILQDHPDAALSRQIDGYFDRILVAQQKDGYLNTYFTIKEPQNKLVDLRKWHELYCAGHFIEAAVAHYQTTGKHKALKAAMRVADQLDSVFGEGKRYDVPGHQEVELALVKLYRATGERRYLELSKFFLDERGYAHGAEHKPFDPKTEIPSKDKWLNRSTGIKQDHKPVVEQTEAVGHAVRAGYMYAAMTDIAALTGDAAYARAVDGLWKDVTSRKLYLTGGVGTAQYHDEGYGDPYLLPNQTAYCETCAAVALTLWSHRMNLLHGDAQYADVMELALYNGFLSGVSLSGDQFFYRNPLASQGKTSRNPWSAPACCPSNVVRIIPQIGNLAYASNKNSVYVNLFMQSSATLATTSGDVRLRQETNYPWDGDVKITVSPPRTAEFDLCVRIPGWARNALVPSDLYRFSDDKTASAVVSVNGAPVDSSQLDRGYLRIHRQWQEGDTVDIRLPMPVRRVYANSKVEDDRGRVALMRGPLVYCLEAADNPGHSVFDMVLSRDTTLAAEPRPDLLRGVTIIRGQGQADGKKLLPLTAIPYYAWANRGAGEMVVWVIEDASLCQ